MAGICNVQEGIFVLETTAADTSVFSANFKSLVTVHFAGLADVVPENKFDLWHCRMGHLNSRDLTRLQKLSDGVLIRKPDMPSLCSACCRAKSTRSPLTGKSNKTSRILQYLFADLVGPYPVPTPSGYRYWLGITDKASSYCWTYLLQRKSDTEEHIRDFVNSQESKDLSMKHGSITFFSTDNGGEFIGASLKAFLKRKSISQQFLDTVVHSRDIKCDELAVVKRYLNFKIEDQQVPQKVMDAVEFTPAPISSRANSSAQKETDNQEATKMFPEVETKKTRSGKKYNRLEAQLDAAFNGIVEISENEPRTLKQALSCKESDGWRSAIETELKVLEKNNT